MAPGGSATDAAVWAIVLAGGVGRRFGDRPKQFETVGGSRLVDRTVAAARRTCGAVSLVLPAGEVWDGEPVDALAVGGEHQSDSLRAGLEAVPAAAGIAVVADPAHPLASDALFIAVIEAVRCGADGAVPVLPVAEVVQRVRAGQVIETLPRAGMVLAQSPQAFRTSVLRSVHADLPCPVENSGLLVERGYLVRVVPGDPMNLHVTTPGELAVAERLATGRDPVEPRSGGRHLRSTGDRTQLKGHAP